MKRLLLLLSLVGFWQISNAQCPPAAPLPTPLYENFDSQASGQTGVFANCWTANTTADPNWETKTGTTNSSGTGPSSDFSGTGTYVYMETSGGALGAVGELATPPISLAGLTVPELRFHYHMYGATMGTLDVQVWDGLTWTSVWMLTGQQQTSLTDPWIEAIVDLSTYTGTIEIKFVGTRGSSFTGDMAVDEFRVQEAPACPQPGNLVVANITSTGADLSWNTVAAATGGYEVIYGTAGFNPATGGTSATSATTTYTLAGLAGNTAYEAYVIADCALSGISDTSAPIGFTTLCAAQPSGTVTIDAALPASATNYQTFAAFASDVNQCGLGGPLTVNVKEGTYTEQVTFNAFTGSSATNTVVIQSDPANTLPVVLTYSPTTSATTENFTLMLDGAMNMEFRDLTIQTGGTSFSRVVQFSGNSDNILFDGNTFNGASVASTSTFNAIFYYIFPVSSSNLTITNNTFNNGSYVAYLSFGTAPLSDNLTITDNTVNGSYSGFYLSNFKNANFSNNTLNLAASTTTQYGVRLYGSSSVPSEQVIIEENHFNLNTTGTTYGAYIGYYVASAVAPSRIQNNFISNAATTGTGTRYMVYPYACDYLNIYHNSINLQDGSATAGRAIYLNTSTSATIISGNVDIRNNIISHTGPGYAIEIATSAVTTGYVTSLSHNLYNYDISNTTAFRLGTSNYADLAAWQVASTLDASSAEGDPVFTSVSNLHALGTAANDIGDNTVGVTTDIDGDARPASGSTTVDIGADEFTPASCAPPSGVTAYGETSNSAMVSWTTGGATAWGVEYGVTGYTQGSGTYMAATNDTVALTGLASQTTYDVYVKDSCSTSSTSPWIGPISFTTLCTSASMPYYESFDAWPPICWDVTLGTTAWTSYTAFGSTDVWAWANFWGTSSGNMIMNSQAVVLSVDAQVRFTWSHLANTASYPDDELIVRVSRLGSGIWDTIDSKKAIDGNFNDPTAANSAPGTGIQDIIILSPTYTGDTIVVQFWGNTDFGPSCYINDFYVEAVPSCPLVTSSSVLITTSSSATIDFNTVGTAVDIEWGAVGFTPGTGCLATNQPSAGTVVISDALAPGCATSIMPSSTYEYYVRNNCSATANGVSGWTGPIQFTTACVAFVAPYMENFDGLPLVSPYTDLPICWEAQVGPDFWDVTDDVVNTGHTWLPNIGDHTTGTANYMWIDASSNITPNEMVSPLIDMSGLANPYAGFWFASNNTTNSINHTISLDAWDGAAWVNVTTERGNFTGWVEVGGLVPAGIPSTTKFRIMAIADPLGTPSDYFYNDLGVDDFFVMQAPCNTYTAPFVEDFEVGSTSSFCWTNEYVADSLDWTLGMGSSGGAISMAHGGTQNAVFVSTFGGPDITRFVSPVIDITPLGSPELRFWYGQEVWFGDQNFLNVYYRDSASMAWTLLFSDSTNQAAWIEAVVTLPTTSATYQLAFEGTNNYGRANVLDDVTILDAPACPAPTMLGVTNITDMTADIYWTGGGLATDWEVQFDDGTTTTVVAAANDTVTLTGLTAGTGYTVFVRDSCGAGNVSVWTGPITFTTGVCAPANSCDYSATLTDAFGDGWNGTEVTVYQNGVAVQVLGQGFTTGFSFGPVTVPLCDGIATYFVITVGTNGVPNYAEEIGLDLNNPFGAVAATYAASATAAQGDTIITITSSCAAPACLPPSNLGAFNETTSSADLFWTGNAGALTYNVQYGPQGFMPGTGTITVASNDTFNLAGLGSSQCYDYWVQSDCGSGDTSIWVGPYAFCTLCATINTFPYVEGFGSAPITSLPACYSDSSTSTGAIFMWTVDAGGTGTSTSGPAADASGSATGNYVYTEASGPSPGDSAFLYLPEFDITSLTTPELVFQYHMYGADITVLLLEVFNAGSGTWTSVDSIVGQQQTSSPDPWLERRFNLNAYSSSSLLMRFLHARGASFAGDVSLDDITIRETPLCVDPTNLAVTAVGETTVSLSWTTDTNITASAVQFGPTGFALGAGTTVPATAAGSMVFGNILNPNTCYDFYVLDSCGSATNWVGPVTACTKPTCGVNGLPGNVTGDSTGCGGGGVTLTAQAPVGMTIGWFQNGQIVGSGSPFIDTIGVTTTYEARNVSLDGSLYHLGPQPSIAAAGFGNFTNGQYITVLDTLVIDSTTVRSNGYVRAQVIITDGQSTTDGGNILQRGEIFTTDSTATLNTQVPVGIVLTPGQYFIGIEYLLGTVGQLFRATGGAVYPYVFPGLMSIDSVNFAGPRYYYTFDLVIQNACISTVGLGAIGYVPGANAGTSDSVAVCETNAAVDLASYLGVYDFGGTWTDDDATGALTDSIFDATAVTVGGTYNFTYIISQSGGCVGGDTATISVTVESSPLAGADTTNTMCISGAPVQLRALLPGSDNGGTMTDLDGSGALVGTLFLPSSLTSAGTYRFRYVVSGGSCPNDTSIITMIVDDVVDAGMDASDTITDCTNPIDLSTYLSATATAGGTWVDASGSGALTGSNFDPAAATNMAGYDFRYVLTSGCGDDSATVSLYLNCPIGLDEYTVGNIDVYPNPTQGVVNIEALTNDNKIKSVEVYSISGALLVKRTADDATVRIDLSGYADGLYNIKVTSERGIELHRINKK